VHSALTLAACVEHLHASGGRARSASRPRGWAWARQRTSRARADHHDAAPGGDADGHVLCQIACEAQAQSRDFVKALEIQPPSRIASSLRRR